ncbi:peptide deformylase [Candidatus Finniella inopinata]|uniref:Peptide deformylase n=1 Tax=Candidatus Finniella inopinata TaxID=1696036 RepID=A0A4V2E028_9PROT|nr:peptide deformylase [Candidatus Finniella inopinata]RZI47107.1 peptide deformylase [Candidatus Finniella inopinata]
MSVKLPPYVVINDPNCPNKEVLETPAKAFTFPLTKEDLAIIKILEAKYDAEENCSGLAAPQIGFSKQAIVFALSDDPDLKKWRPDISDTMPKTLWLNPSYEPVGDDKHIDYEGCFSVADVAGPVARYKTIKYAAYSKEGTKIEGVAHGFLARVMQHEIDHIRGILYTQYVPDGKLLPVEEYRRMRVEAMEKGIAPS